MEASMVRAVWNGAVLAESDHTVKVEGNHYFPPGSLNREYFTASQATSTCPWKGLARYYSITVDGKTNQDAAWYYAEPSPAARKIAGHVAFWHGVRIESGGTGAEPGGGAGRGRVGRVLGRLPRLGARP
jgi:uncharacterized protein (DUF427 family)